MNITISKRSIFAVILGISLVAGVTACAVDKQGENKKLTVFATTGYIGDTVKNIAPDADVTVMVGPGGDPHTYQPTTQDTEKISSSDLVFWSGLHMEAHMIDQLRSQGDRQVAVAEAIPKEDLLDWPDLGENGEKLYDPHVWNSTENWKYVVQAITDKLAATDPVNKDKYQENAKKYEQSMDETAAYVREKINAIPEDKRILITGHDAFNYFGKQFGLEIRATDFVTSESQISPAEIKELGEYIAEKQIKTIFQDNLANPQAINSLQETVKAGGWEVTISDKELFADSLGPNPPVDTYLGVMKYNADTISAALAS